MVNKQTLKSMKTFSAMVAAFGRAYQALAPGFNNDLVRTIVMDEFVMLMSAVDFDKLSKRIDEMVREIEAPLKAKKQKSRKTNKQG